MRNPLKKLAIALSTAALIAVGAANLYADNYKPDPNNEAEMDRFVTVTTGK